MISSDRACAGADDAQLGLRHLASAQRQRSGTTGRAASRMKFFTIRSSSE